jgi:hypothetical protein
MPETSVTVATSGVIPFGITSSGAPPSVLPPPMNSGALRSIGETIPLTLLNGNPKDETGSECSFPNPKALGSIEKCTLTPVLYKPDCQPGLDSGVRERQSRYPLSGTASHVTGSPPPTASISNTLLACPSVNELASTSSSTVLVPAAVTRMRNVPAGTGASM